MSYSFEDLQKELSFEEVVHFFSQTNEFSVEKADEHGSIKLTLKCLDEKIDTIMYKPTFQTLIRDIQSLGYRKHLELERQTQYNEEIFDKVCQIIKKIFYSNTYLSVKIESSLSNDLGLDDLDIVEMVMELEKEFNLPIEDEAVSTFTTIGKVVDYIQLQKLK